DENKKEIKITIQIDPYTPVLVLKTFVKMGLTLLPEEETANFRLALEWIRTPDHNIDSMFKMIIFHTFFPGSYRGDVINVEVFRRKLDDMDVPYAFMILCYGNEMFQVFLPAPERDQHVHGKKLKYRYLSLLDFQ